MYYKKPTLWRSCNLALLAGVLAAVFTQAAETTEWMGPNGSVLLQNNDQLGLQAVHFASQELWTDIPERTSEWQAVAMSGSQVLFFYEPAFEMARRLAVEEGIFVGMSSNNVITHGTFS